VLDFLMKEVQNMSMKSLAKGIVASALFKKLLAAWRARKVR